MPCAEENKLLALGLEQKVLDAFKAAGVDLTTLLGWIVHYGLPVIAWIAHILGITLPPIPLPPAPPLPSPPGVLPKA